MKLLKLAALSLAVVGVAPAFGEEFCEKDSGSGPRPAFQSDCPTRTFPPETPDLSQPRRTWSLGADNGVVRFAVCTPEEPIVWNSTLTFAQYQAKFSLTHGGPGQSEAYGNIVLSLQKLDGQSWLQVDWYAPVSGDFDPDTNSTTTRLNWARFPVAFCGSTDVSSQLVEIRALADGVQVTGPRSASALFTIPRGFAPIPTKVDVYPFMNVGDGISVVYAAWERPRSFVPVF